MVPSQYKEAVWKLVLGYFVYTNNIIPYNRFFGTVGFRVFYANSGFKDDSYLP